jgi:hypothetical protein
MRWLFVAMLILLVSVPAHADTRAVEDAESGDTMDAVEATHGHHPTEKGVLVHTITMAQPWDNSDLVAISIKIRFSKDDAKPARRVWVDQNADGSLRARILGKRGQVIGHGNAWRPDDRSLQVEFSRKLLGRRIAAYRWRVKVFQPCPQSQPECVIEFDYVPDKGEETILHRL